MNHDFDVVVAGGGPAGSSTANFLRQKKRSVLVLEREKFPRFHIGESMLPFSNDVWRELGVFEKMDAQYFHKPGAKFIHEESAPSSPTTSTSRSAPATPTRIRSSAPTSTRCCSITPPRSAPRCGKRRASRT